MPLTIYGNYISLDAPAGLQLNAKGIEKLYRLANVDAKGQVAPSLLASSVVEQMGSADNGSISSCCSRRDSWQGAGGASDKTDKS